MIKIGIFILPDLRLKKEIINFKKKVKSSYGNQIYLDHLPHCSIFVFNTKKKYLKKINQEAKTDIKLRGNFQLDNTVIFQKDPITKGNTYIFKIKKNDFLKKLQKKIVKKFFNFPVKSKNIFKNKQMFNNFNKYGYPFINSNWKPHFTISSIHKNKNQKEFKKNFKKYKLNKRKLYLSKINLYLINKNKHKLICQIKIN
jgi:hypothetical protein